MNSFKKPPHLAEQVLGGTRRREHACWDPSLAHPTYRAFMVHHHSVTLLQKEMCQALPGVAYRCLFAFQSPRTCFPPSGWTCYFWRVDSCGRVSLTSRCSTMAGSFEQLRCAARRVAGGHVHGEGWQHQPSGDTVPSVSLLNLLMVPDLTSALSVPHIRNT